MNRKPRLAWVRQAYSQDDDEADSRDRTYSTYNSKENVFNAAKSQTEKWNFEKSKRKSIDIFLARRFIDPTDVVPGAGRTRKGDTNLRFRTFGPASDKKLQRLAAYPDEKFFVPASVSTEGVDDFSDCYSNVGSEKIATSSSPYRTEKRVTFASDLLVDKKMDAETRRLHFRNSHSKIHKNLSTRDKRNSFDGVPPTRFAEYNWQSFAKTTNSGEWPENEAGVEYEKRGCSSANPSKQSSIKRKLKSCRSRSFHKSLDTPPITDNAADTKYSFTAPSRRGQTEVVTMVSLLTSYDEPNADVDVNVENQLNDCHPELKTDANVDKKCKEVKSKSKDDRMKSGILRTRLSVERNPPAGSQSSQKSRLTNDSRNSKSISQSSAKFGRMHSFDNSEISDHARVYEGQDENENTITLNGEGDGYVVLDKMQSRKEEECWSSFRKMSNKGVFVSFDTILRGLLTPTEYRLRRKELAEE